MYLRHCLVTLLLPLAVLSSPTVVKRDTTTIEQDIDNVETMVNSLDGAITKFSSNGGTLDDAIDIQDVAQRLGDVAKYATTNINNSEELTWDEANQVLDLMETNFVPSVEQLLTQVQGMEAQSDAPKSATRRTVVNTIASSIDPLVEALAIKVPGSLADRVKGLTTSLNRDISGAITALYSP